MQSIEYMCHPDTSLCASATTNAEQPELSVPTAVTNTRKYC